MGVIGTAVSTNICYFINFLLANIATRLNPILNKANVPIDFS